MKNLTSLRILLLICLLGALICAFYSCQNGSEKPESSLPQNQDQMETEKLIIGTYTGDGPDKSKGIYMVTRNVKTGELSLDSPVSYTHLRAHETDSYLVCRLL